MVRLQKLLKKSKGFMMKYLSSTIFVSMTCTLFMQISMAQAQTENTQELASDPEVRGFGEHLCFLMVNANATGKDIVKTMEDQMLAYMNISRSTANYKDEIIKFYNANHHDFICQGKIHSGTRETEHLMKRAVALSIHNKVFYNFLLNNPNTDVNAIEWVIGDPAASEYLSEMQKVTHAPWGTGEPETILDYLDKILADPEASIRYVISDIKRLRKMLIDYFNAKTAKELGY
jgi:hypothetical protein